MAQMDTDGGGTISFNEFEEWWHANGGDLEVHRDRALTVGAGEITLLLVAPDLGTKAKWVEGCRDLLTPAAAVEAPEPEPVRFEQQQLAPAPTLVIPPKKARDILFHAMDYNGNGGLSLAEIDKAVVSGLVCRALVTDDENAHTDESYDHKPALMRAYKAADRSGDGFIQRSEFVRLLQYMVYFNNLWHKFSDIDTDHDRRLDLGEFTTACGVLGLTVSPQEAATEFAKCDADGGGMILFGEFCSWCAARHIDGMGEAGAGDALRQAAVDTVVPQQQSSFGRGTMPAHVTQEDVDSAVEALRGALTRRWKSLSYGQRGQDPSKLFAQLDKDNSGELDPTEFKTAVRKAGQISAELMSDEELELMFYSIDRDGNGVVTVNELTHFIWGDTAHMDSAKLAHTHLDDLEPEPEPEPELSDTGRAPGLSVEVVVRTEVLAARAKKKLDPNLPWEDSKLAARTDVNQMSPEKIATLRRIAATGTKLPPKMRPLDPSAARPKGSATRPMAASDAHNSPRKPGAPQCAAAVHMKRHRAREPKGAHAPRKTVYDREREKGDYWSDVKRLREEKAAKASAAANGTMRGAVNTSLNSSSISASGSGVDTSFATAASEFDASSAWQEPSATSGKWYIGESTLFPDELPEDPRSFDNTLSATPARARSSRGFATKTTPNQAPGTPQDQGSEDKQPLAPDNPDLIPQESSGAQSDLGLRRLASAAGQGSAREREYRAKLANHGTTDYERTELRQMRLSVREKLTVAWKALSYSERGQDPGKLFKQFDTDNSGFLDVLEFRNAVRKAGQITPTMMSDKSIMRLFRAIDLDGGGQVTVDELAGFLWGPSPTGTPASSPNASRAASPSASPEKSIGNGSSVSASDRSAAASPASRREEYAAAYEVAGVVAVGGLGPSEEEFTARMDMEMRFATLSEDDSGGLMTSPSPTWMDASPAATSPHPPMMQSWSPGSSGTGGGGGGGESLLPSSGRSSPAVNRVSIDT